MVTKPHAVNGTNGITPAAATRRLVVGPEVSQSVVERSPWQEFLAASLQATGTLRILEKLSRGHELSTGRRFPRIQRATASRYVILCYHRIGTQGLPLYSYLAPQHFEAQMRFIQRHYRVVSLAQVCSEIGEGKPAPPSVAVTFDDGYRDVFTNAFPILQKYQIPATVYAAVESIQTGSVPWYDRVFLALQVFEKDVLELPLAASHPYPLSDAEQRFRAAQDIVSKLRRLPDSLRKEASKALEQQVTLPAGELEERMLTWDQVQLMHRGGIAFGSHTMTHPVVSRLEQGDLEYELVESKRRLEAKLDACVSDFAFPFGQPDDCGRYASEELRRYGYRSAVTTSWGINRPTTSLFALSRVQIGEECSLPMFALRLNQLFFQSSGMDASAPGRKISHQASLPHHTSSFRGHEE